MKTYRVGGAVRDKLLGRPTQDNDWVVVGATPEELEAQGYKRVGSGFPVFLHPETGDEYALARTERKSAPGYKGFTIHAAPDVTLEDDLRRRDLTINALAEDVDGNIIDPFGGKSDLERGILRHVSPAFAEDPLRVLRVARFAARFKFEIAEETLELMRQIAESGELEHLVPERVWTETERALAEPLASRYFDVLRVCGAVGHLFPELETLYGVPQPANYHPEIDTGIHTMMVLEQACALSSDARVRFAALLHDLGKGTTPREDWPSHRGHEERSVVLINSFCDRYRVPTRYRELAVAVALYHPDCHRILEMRPSSILRKLEELDAFRRPDRFEQFLIACEADARGRKGFEERDYPQAAYFRRAFTAAREAGSEDLDTGALTGEQVGAAIRIRRLEAISRALAS
ncbi:MAG: multifunctional CCA addition/repair protein [Gammaproteobacteria bacterium]